MNKDKIKVAVFDIDGTIYDHDAKKVHDDTIASFHALKDLGIKIGICTSRTYEETNNIDDEILNMMDFIITSAGSRVTIDGEDVLIKTLDQNTCDRLFAYADKHDLAIRYSVDERRGYFNMPVDDVLIDWFHHAFDYVPTVKAYQQDKIVNIAVIDEDIKNHIPALKDLSLKAQHVLMEDVYFEITPERVNKAYALDFIAETFDVAIENIVAFGDGENDAAMLKKAGFGVAMDNGAKKTKEAADFITEPVSQGGVTYALKKYGVI